MSIDATIASLEAEEDELVFPSFDPADAWALGTLITRRATEAAHRVCIDIRRPDLILFRAALPGVTPDHQRWIDRKSALVLRLEQSSALADARFTESGIDPATLGWLDPNSYVATGGSFPIRVNGVGVVAAATASGLSSEDDHRLIVDGIRQYLGR
jgi:uncharacterized protein (UPF0303 family)